jgi:hypothetical protein
MTASTAKRLFSLSAPGAWATLCPARLTEKNRDLGDKDQPASSNAYHVLVPAR